MSAVNFNDYNFRYAIIICKLIHVDKKGCKKHMSELKADIKNHLERATKIDSKDPFAWHLLGVYHFENKDYKEALTHFQKAEGIRVSIYLPWIFFNNRFFFLVKILCFQSLPHWRMSPSPWKEEWSHRNLEDCIPPSLKEQVRWKGQERSQTCSSYIPQTKGWRNRSKKWMVD